MSILLTCGSPAITVTEGLLARVLRAIVKDIHESLLLLGEASTRGGTRSGPRVFVTDFHRLGLRCFVALERKVEVGVRHFGGFACLGRRGSKRDGGELRPSARNSPVRRLTVEGSAEETLSLS